MAVPWGLVTVLIGVLYGYFTPGRQDKMALLKKGLIIGIVLALVFALIGEYAGAGALGLGAGFLAVVIGVVVLTALFVLGAWIGDLLEGAPKRN